MKIRGRRWSDEVGPEASARNWGRLALALIPTALAFGATWWIATAFWWVDFARALRIDQRTMTSVGISSQPVAPIVIVNHDDQCLRIESSFMEGRRLVFYVKNTCNRWLDLPNYLYRVQAHDGTVVESGRWAFDGDKGLSPLERREQRVSFDKDDRMERVELWVTD